MDYCLVERRIVLAELGVIGGFFRAVLSGDYIVVFA
jgi:hypothetical protein